MNKIKFRNTMKSFKIILNTIIAITFLAGMSACNNMGSNQNGQSGMEEQVEETKADIQQDKDKLKSEIQDAIDDFDQKIDKFQANLKESGKEMDDKTKEAIDELKDERAKLKLRLDEIGDKTRENWEEFKNKAENQTQEFKQGINDFFEGDDK